MNKVEEKTICSMPNGMIWSTFSGLDRIDYSLPDGNSVTFWIKRNHWVLALNAWELGGSASAVTIEAKRNVSRLLQERKPTRINVYLSRLCQECGDDATHSNPPMCERCFNDAEDIEDDPLCGACSGSGEGMHDGTKCWTCGGKGTIKRNSDDECERDYYSEWKDEQIERGIEA